MRNWLNGKAAASVSPLAAEPQQRNNSTQSGAGVAPDNHGTRELSIIRPSEPNHSLARLVPDIEHAIAVRNVLVEALKRLMQRDTDYGTIKGTNRDTLLQPGADKLANLFRLVVRYEFVEKEEDWTGERHGGEPFFYYVVAGRAWLGDALMGEGLGSCNSWEEKYRWRSAERTCPQCGKPNIRKSRDGGWYCWKKTDGCGTVFNDGDPAIENQQTGKKANPNSADLPNTIMKMAMKRSKISTIINATSASEFFTQDVEDFTVVDDSIDIGGRQPNSHAAAQYVAEQKIANGDASSKVPWKTMRELAESFQAVRESVGESEWLAELERYGWHSFQDMRKELDQKDATGRKRASQRATECYWHLVAMGRKGDR